ncbi:hypothetical protein R1sor_020690 [Riccia sorocarpa]|uniref:Isopentenyl phosphate kinase n=1 Tax=Riccia sorocarpa TaxID=122646 RepID=A0ABD3GKL8_9MARC
MDPPENNIPRPVRCIIKLGGSSATEKDKFETLNESLVSTTAKQLKEAFVTLSGKQHTMDWSRGSDYDQANSLPEDSSYSGFQLDLTLFVVVHGAGSYGHFQAKKGRVNLGDLAEDYVKAGFVATRISVTKLNHEIVRALAKECIPAVGVSPFCAGWSTRNRLLERENVADVQRLLQAGLLPVVHGDAVLDSGQGCAILSGDVIIRQLAETLKPSFVVFLTNVPGVYDRPPSDPNAVLLKEIAVTNGTWKIVDPPEVERGMKVQTSVAAHDTTGGMETKIAEAASIASCGIPVLVVETGSRYALEALKGTPINDRGDWVGTLIRQARSDELDN